MESIMSGKKIIYFKMLCLTHGFVLTSVSLQQGGQTQTLTLQPAQPPQAQPDGQSQTAVVAQSGQQGQQQQQQFLQVSVEGSKHQ